MSYSAAALVGRTVYVQSGKDFYALDLDATSEGWKTLPTWPGEGHDLALPAGVDGKFVLETERGKAVKDSPGWIKANTAVTFMQGHHTGFNQNILVFDSKTGKWLDDGYLPTPGVATTQPVKWKDELLLVSGEIMPGKRTPKIWAGLPRKK